MRCCWPIHYAFLCLHINACCKVWVLYQLRHADCRRFGPVWERLLSLSTLKKNQMSVIFGGVKLLENVIDLIDHKL